jgi:hypothetical protein
MRYAFVAAATAALVAPAFADTLPVPPPGGVIVSPDGQVVISSTLCGALGAPPPDVPGPNYVPGVDAAGKPVAPADLPSAGPPLDLDNFPIEVKAKLAGRFGVPPGGAPYGAKAIIGYVTVHDGRAYFNGAPLAEDDQAALAAACRATKP